MGREIQQKESREDADRNAINRALERASRNTIRPPARNQKMIRLLKELSILYLEDVSERASSRVVARGARA